MGRHSSLLAAIALGIAVSAIGYRALADETSTGDKLRILYSNRFTFTHEGSPLVTIEVMSGQTSVRLRADAGMRVLPDGDGGAAIDAGNDWTVTVSQPVPARIREWTIVARLGAEDEPGIRAAIKQWRERGFSPRRFEVGTVFGVAGEVIDGREVTIGIAPTKRGDGHDRSIEIAQTYKVATSVHEELERRPSGTIVARSGDVVLQNPSVLWFEPRPIDGTITVENVIAGAAGSQLTTRREDRSYAGKLYVSVGSDGALVVANAISAEILLAGLVPAEIFPDAAIEALKSQAIAARTELLQKIGTRHLTDPFLLCSSQHCQVYAGAGHEHERTTRAVRGTRGLIMLREGGGIIDARYSASCGGHSEHKEIIWGGAPDPSLRGHLDVPRDSPLARRFASGINDDNVASFIAEDRDAGYCGSTRFARGRYRWTRRFSAAELSTHIAAHHPQVGVVHTLEPLTRGVSGRVVRLRITGSEGSVIASGDLAIRRMLGGLRSSLFTVTAEGAAGPQRSFEFLGAGFGHGVGMCQTGAIGMAERGHSYGAILQHYYPGTRVQRLY